VAKTMTKDGGQGTAPVVRTRPHSIVETFFRSPFPELSIARELMNAVAPSLSQAASFVPNVELYEKDGSYVIDAALPGFKKDDIDIEISGNEITVSGTYEQRQDDRKTHYSEMQQSSFTRTFVLPREIDVDKVSASFENGMLCITASPAGAVPAKKVAIKGEA